MMGVRLTTDEFQELVAKALDTLPQEVLDLLDNVDVLTQLWPSADQMDETDTKSGYGLLGLYEGTPLIRQGALQLGAAGPGHPLPATDRGNL